MEIQALSPEVIQDTSDTGVRSIPADAIDATFKSTSIDLISGPLGSKILSFSDEWFAAASNLLTPTPPIRRPGVFTHSGAWYDGWETRRHNPEPYDWVIVRLGVASGRVKGVEIDTAYFNGNHAPEVSVEGYFSTSDDTVTASGFAEWETILPVKACGPSQRHAWELGGLTQKAYTHVRLRMYPDGGIARFRLYGVAVPVFPESIDEVFDLAATVNGGLVTAFSDQHFGLASYLLLPGRGRDMGDGWETKRTRGAHVDWAVVRLGAVGEIDRLLVDTAHFRGNYPKEVQVFALLEEGEGEGKEVSHDDERWVEILSPQPTGPDREHVYQAELMGVQGRRWSHAKLVMIPDGGIKRFRVFGRRRV